MEYKQFERMKSALSEMGLELKNETLFYKLSGSEHLDLMSCMIESGEDDLHFSTSPEVLGEEHFVKRDCQIVPACCFLSTKMSASLFSKELDEVVKSITDQSRGLSKDSVSLCFIYDQNDRLFLDA